MDRWSALDAIGAIIVFSQTLGCGATTDHSPVQAIPSEVREEVRQRSRDKVLLADAIDQAVWYCYENRKIVDDSRCLPTRPICERARKDSIEIYGRHRGTRYIEFEFTPCNEYPVAHCYLYEGRDSTRRYRQCFVTNYACEFDSKGLRGDDHLIDPSQPCSDGSEAVRSRSQ